MSAPSLDRAKAKKLALEDIMRLRLWLEDAEKAVKKGRLFSAYKAFKGAKHAAFIGADHLSTATYPAAVDWGHVVRRG